MTKLTRAITDSLEEEFQRSLNALKTRQFNTREYLTLSGICMRKLNSLDFFSNKNLINLIQDYNTTQIDILSMEELANSGLELLILPQKFEDLEPVENRLNALCMIENEFYLKIKKSPNKKIIKVDVIYLKLVQAIYQLNRGVSQDYVMGFNKLFKTKSGPQKKIVPTSEYFGYGLSIE